MHVNTGCCYIKSSVRGLCFIPRKIVRFLEIMTVVYIQRVTCTIIISEKEENHAADDNPSQNYSQDNPCLNATPSHHQLLTEGTIRKAMFINYRAVEL